MQTLIPVKLRETRPAAGFGHIKALDGLRGLAVLLVFFRHSALLAPATKSTVLAGLSRVFSFGQCGVDLFFVLSGFLITRILLKTVHAPGYWRNFIIHRALRILPLYYGVLIVAFIASVFFPGSALANLCPLSKQAFLWLFVSFSSQSATSHPLGYLDHFWSLAVEVQFYLLWAAVIASCRISPLRRICIAMLCAAPLLRAYYFFTHDYMAAYVLLPCRFDALAVGALLAICLRENELQSMVGSAKSQVIFWLFLIPIFCGGAVASYPALSIGTPTFFALFFATVLILALYSRRARALMETPALRFLGRYSYGFYVFHYIVIQLLIAAKFHVLDEYPVASFCAASAIAFVATLSLSALSFHLYEQPFLKLKRYVQ